MRYLLLFFMIGLAACSKPNPNPELTDEIYLDYTAQAENNKKEAESEKKKLEEAKKELDTVVPQTGAIKFAQKRFFESELKVQKLEQQAKFYELKAETRKHYAQVEYNKAFRAGKTWPDPSEAEEYKKHKELAAINPSWDSKRRLKEYTKATGFGATEKKGGEGGEKKAEAPKKEE